MKKAIVLLLALAVLGGAVFAQATVTGYVRTIATYSSDSFALTGQRLRLNLGWTSEDKNVSFAARLQSADFSAIGVGDYAYGVIKLLDGKVVVTGGKLWNFDYDLSSGLSDYNLGNVANGGGYGLFAAQKGMIVQAMPVEGLSIGVLAVPDAAKLDLTQFALGASYTIAGVGDIVLSNGFADPIDKSAFSASFNYTGVEGLGVAVGYKGLDTLDFYSIVNYEMDALTAQLAGEYNVDNKTMYFETSVKYVSGPWTVMGLFGYDKDGTILGSDATNTSYSLNTKTGTIDPKAGTAAVVNKYLVGAEIAYNLGKGQIAFNPTFDDAHGFSLPIVVKVSF